ncbi:hypothetical protein [Catalinimonas niigatensis]|uniref:hypothetical protein n=1 Tax=Catalinimonas niigatensis TaxID=1397264 RepID=UPI0026665924|nr:hypothetical protein [Catalinimonas niigatensis]WPP49687.1 hypothetical protein PZB72_23720 [Catalinimonas niigatensis]
MPICEDNNMSRKRNYKIAIYPPLLSISQSGSPLPSSSICGNTEISLNSKKIPSGGQKQIESNKIIVLCRDIPFLLRNKKACDTNPEQQVWMLDTKTMMRTNKTLLAFITLCLFSLQTSLSAQDSDAQDYLVLNMGDTLYGNIKHIDESGTIRKYYKKIRFTDRYGKQKKYKRKEVSAFSVNNTHYEGFWLNQSSQKIILVNPRYDIDAKNGEQYFLKVMRKGKLSHYQLEWFEQGESLLSGMDLLKKEGDPFFIRATQGLLGLKRKVLLDYFSDCAKLQEQIKERQLNEVGQVVDFYHTHCIY